MIQPQPAQRGAIGEGHGLQRLTSSLEALSQGQTAQQTRDTHIQERLATQAHELAKLARWGQVLAIALVVSMALSLGMGTLLWWKLGHLAMVQLMEPSAPPTRAGDKPQRR